MFLSNRSKVAVQTDVSKYRIASIFGFENQIGKKPAYKRKQGLKMFTETSDHIVLHGSIPSLLKRPTTRMCHQLLHLPL
jgi:hypothetical protein